VRALLRAVLWNIPVTCNRASADFVISSPLISQPWQRQQPGDRAHIDRRASPAVHGGEGRAAA